MKLPMETQMAVPVYEQLIDLLRPDSEVHQSMFDLTEMNLTEFFTAIIIASKLLYEKLTEDKIDLLDFQAIQNRLVTQYLIRQNKNKALMEEIEEMIEEEESEEE